MMLLFIFPTLSVCLEGLGVSRQFEGPVTGFLATLIPKTLARSMVLLETGQNQNSGTESCLIQNFGGGDI